MRLLRQRAGDVALTMRLNAQRASMVRTSLAAEGRLMRVQAVRQKREAIEATAIQDARTLHVVEQCLLPVTGPDIEQPAAASPGAAPGEATRAAPRPYDRGKRLII